MPGDAAPAVTVVPVRVPCGTHRCAFGPRRGLVGRLSNALDFGAPLTFGVAAWLSACRLTWAMRWLKTDSPDLELDPIA